MGRNALGTCLLETTLSQRNPPGKTSLPYLYVTKSGRKKEKRTGISFAWEKPLDFTTVGHQQWGQLRNRTKWRDRWGREEKRWGRRLGQHRKKLKTLPGLQ